MRATLLLAVIWVVGITGAAAQDKPVTLCTFDGFSGTPKLAEIVSAKTTLGYYGCQSGKNCLATKLEPGDAVEVYRVEGDWTCGYLSNRTGAGPGWVKSKDIRLLPLDPNPTPDAWTGTWANGDNRIQIQLSKTPGRLNLEGSAVWHGIKGVVHTGEFAGEASPDGNHLLFVEAGADSCTVDLTLIGKYIVADDNDQCGGANVRFWGIWKRSGN